VRRADRRAGFPLESSCLGVQLKARGKLHVRLNMTPRPIANKYREGKLKRTLKREFNEYVKLCSGKRRGSRSGPGRFRLAAGCPWLPRPARASFLGRPGSRLHFARDLRDEPLAAERGSG
jgi:hypothetical protein